MDTTTALAVQRPRHGMYGDVFLEFTIASSTTPAPLHAHRDDQNRDVTRHVITTRRVSLSRARPTWIQKEEFT